MAASNTSGTLDGDMRELGKSPPPPEVMDRVQKNDLVHPSMSRDSTDPKRTKLESLIHSNVGESFDRHSKRISGPAGPSPFVPTIQSSFESGEGSSFRPANEAQRDLLVGEQSTQQGTREPKKLCVQSDNGGKDKLGNSCSDVFGDPGDPGFNAAVDEVSRLDGEVTPEILDKIERFRNAAIDLEKQANDRLEAMYRSSGQLWTKIQSISKQASGALEQGYYFEAMASFQVLLDETRPVSDSLAKAKSIHEKTKDKVHAATHKVSGNGYWISKSYDELQSLRQEIMKQAPDESTTLPGGIGPLS